MNSDVRAALAPALVCFAAVSSAVTPGWENADPGRSEFPPVETVWTAPAGGMSVEKSGGAEGEVVFDGGAVRIRKTNGRGRIVVSAPAFKCRKGRELRFFADVTARAERPMAARGYLCAYGAERRLDATDEIGRKWFAAGGEYMTKLINSAPGMTYRKYTHFAADGAAVTPVIVVEGEPSESTWRGWTAEDLDAAQKAWEVHKRALTYPDRSGDMADDDAFSRALADDIDHTAEIRVVDGTSRLFVDGRETPPVVYKSPSGEWSDGERRVTYSGKPLQRAGVRLGVVNLHLGKLPTRDGPWSERGFDVKAAAASVRRSMRAGDESCFILAIGTSAYPKFTEEHPDEVWRKEDGSVVRGNSGSAIPDEYNDGGRVDPGDVRWPWVSYSSPAWRDAVNRNVAALVEELRAQRLLKRIVGVHFYGYHDGQFAVPVADHSPCAMAEYRRYLAERGLRQGDPGSEYAFFMKQIGFRALECFSRAAKKAMGKPIVAVRWCMLPFCGLEGSYDIGSFLRSDAVDVIVPQPTYTQRLPGLAQGVRLPCDSLHRHGKMMWYEFDLRTWAALDFWALSVTATKGLGQCDDIAMWRTVFRKHAGIMTAQRMGWWLYDMAGGWFYPPEIVADVKEVYDFRRALQYERPSAWQPDAALVIDELALALYNRPGFPSVPDPQTIVIAQWPQTALSGVPYDVILAEDLERTPSLAGRYKAMALCGFLHPDARQRRLMDAIAAAGARTFVVQPGGYSPEFFHDFVRDAGGYVATRPGGVQIDMNGDFLSVHCVVPGRYDVRLPFAAKAINLKSWKTEKTPDGKLALELSAGETCWFRLESPSTAASVPATEPLPRFDDEHPHRGPHWWTRRMAEKRAEAESRRGVFDLVMIGDSITHFWEYNAGDVYADLTNRMSVLNLGYGGDNTRSVLWRLTEGGELDGVRAKAVMLMIGTNNHHDAPEKIAEAVGRIVSELEERLPRAKIFLMPILPRALRGVDDSGPRRRNEAVNGIVRGLSDGRRIFWMDCYDRFLNADGSLRQELYMDGLHLNRAGFAVWRDVVTNALEAVRTVP